MHEVGITRELLRMTLDGARQAQLTRVSAVEAKGHGLSPEELEAVRLHWELAAKGTLAEGSRLSLEAAPARANCLDCGWEGLPGAAQGLPGSPQELPSLAQGSPEASKRPAMAFVMFTREQADAEES